MTLTLVLWPRLKQVGNKVKETCQNIESKAWLVSKCIFCEKETCILVVQDNILKGFKMDSHFGSWKSWGVSNHVQIKCSLNCLKGLDDYYIWNNYCSIKFPKWTCYEKVMRVWKVGIWEWNYQWHAPWCLPNNIIINFLIHWIMENFLKPLSTFLIFMHWEYKRGMWGHCHGIMMSF